MFKNCEEWYGRGSNKYDPEVHLPLLIEIFENLHGVAAFCAASKICRKTFWDWCNKYPEFKKQYDIAIDIGASKWENLPLELASRGLTLNHNYWIAIQRNRFKFSQSRMKVETEDTTTARMKAATESLQEGGITPQEFNQIASGLSTESRIKEVDLQKEIVDNAKNSCTISKEMKDEALKAFMLVMSGKGKVVDNESIRSSE
ncbi:MAG TPA: hypothetical protein PKK61_02425 [Defluviitaleaceae bacterium]|nr:hypothetical protein [Defluviitaleaceae bacterium]